MSYRALDSAIIDAIAAAGFDVYQPETGLKTYLFFTDGKQIGYLQRGDWGGLSLSTVHIPNRESGTGFRVTEDKDPPLELTREGLSKAFMHAPQWAGQTMWESVRKWPDMDTFIGNNKFNPLIRVRSAVANRQG